MCKKIERISIPDYYPSYMIQHGISALLKKNTPPIVANFDAPEEWKLTLQNYLRCDASAQ